MSDIFSQYDVKKNPGISETLRKKDMVQVEDSPEGIEVPRYVYEMGQKLIADSPDDPDTTIARLNSSYHLSRQLGIPIEEAYGNFDTLTEEYYGKVTPPQSTWEAISNSYKAASLGTKIADLGYQLFMARGNEESIYKQIQELEAQMPDEDTVKRLIPTKAIKWAAQFLPSQIESYRAGMVQGAGTAAGVTALTAGYTALTGPAAPAIGALTLPSIALISFGVGASAGSAERGRQIETGALYYDLLKYSDPVTGARINPKAAWRFAAAYGGLAGIVEMIEADEVLKVIPGLKKATMEALTDVASQAKRSGIAQTQLLKFLGKAREVATKRGGSVVTETMEETVEEGLSILGEEFAKQVTERMDGTQMTPATAQEISKRITETVVGTALGMGALGGISTMGSLFLPAVKTGVDLAKNAKMASQEMNIAGTSLTPEAMEAYKGRMNEPLPKDIQVRASSVVEGEVYTLKAGSKTADPATGKATRYGWLRYQVDRDDMKVSILGYEKGAEPNVNAALTQALMQRFPGWEIAANAKDPSISAMHQILTAENPRGPEAGLQWFKTPAKEDQTITYDYMRDRLKEAKPGWSEEDVEFSIRFVDTMAKAMGTTGDKLADGIFAKGIIGDAGARIAAQGAYGAITQDWVDGKFKTLIQLTKSSNPSTWMHESTHAAIFFALENRKTDAKVDAFLSELEGLLGVKNGDWNAEAPGWAESYKGAKYYHEALAYAVEDYFLTGKVPDPKMKSLFHKIAKWLTDLYKSLKEARYKISPELEAYFDRLFASPESPLYELATTKSEAEARPAPQPSPVERPAPMPATEAPQAQNDTNEDKDAPEAPPDARAKEMEIYQGYRDAQDLDESGQPTDETGWSRSRYDREWRYRSPEQRQADIDRTVQATGRAMEAPAAGRTEPSGYIKELYQADGQEADQTDSEAFKQWFGDSKVVDSEGKPLVVYHGTDADNIIFFDWSMLGDNTTGNAYDIAYAATSKVGAWFNSGEIKAAKNSPYKKYIDVYLAIENPKEYGSLEELAEEIRPYIEKWNDAEWQEANPEIGFDDLMKEWKDEEVDDDVDGLIIQDEEYGGTSYVAFSPTQIKSVKNYGTWSKKDPRMLYQGATDQEWTYKSEQLIAEKIKGPMTGAQILKMLKAAGVKADELKWTGLDEFLNTTDKKTPQEVQEYIAANKLHIEEVEKNEKKKDPSRDLEYELAELRAIYQEQREKEKDLFTEDKRLRARHDSPGGDILEISERMNKDPEVRELNKRFKEHNDRLVEIQKDIDKVLDLIEKDKNRVTTKYSSYTIPGGTNYREVVFTLPLELTLPPEAAADRSTIANIREHGVPSGYKYAYKSSHWDEANVLAHTRLNDRTDSQGRRMLFVEEIQSDWHQEGRKKGYKQQSTDYSKWTAEIENPEAEWESFFNDTYIIKNEEGIIVSTITDANNEEEALERAIRADRTHINDITVKIENTVPDAPFRKTWHEFVFKRILREAAENEYDVVGWTTGEQQADRYSLSKSIGKLEYDTSDNTLTALDPEKTKKVIQGSYKPEELPDVIGKEAAEKLLSTPQDDEGVHTLEGLDLKVGGDGMKGFYDKMLVDYANKYGKKWGAQVETTSLGVGEWNIVDAGTGVADGKIIKGGFETREAAEAHAEKNSISYYEVVQQGKEIHALPVTDEMRASVMQGQILFQKTLETLLTLDELAKAAEDTSDWSDWYERHENQITEYFGKDASVFKKILSATSQATSVAGNVTLAIKAYNQMLSGDRFEGYLSPVVKNLERIKAEEQIQGAKISEFGKANSGDNSGVAVDRHIAELIFGTQRPNAAQIEKAIGVINEIANKLGWHPRGVQAALWAYNQIRKGMAPASYNTFLTKRKDEIKKIQEKHGRDLFQGAVEKVENAVGDIAADLEAEGIRYTVNSSKSSASKYITATIGDKAHWIRVSDHPQGNVSRGVGPASFDAVVWNNWQPSFRQWLGGLIGKELNTYEETSRETKTLERGRLPAELYQVDELYHGAKAGFTYFDHSYMGTGEGQQVYGWGTYLTESKGVARSQYADRLGKPFTLWYFDKTGSRVSRTDGISSIIAGQKELLEEFKRQFSAIGPNHNPSDTQEIRKALEKAIDISQEEEAGKHIMDDIDWEKPVMIDRGRWLYTVGVETKGKRASSPNIYPGKGVEKIYLDAKSLERDEADLYSHVGDGAMDADELIDWAESFYEEEDMPTIPEKNDFKMAFWYIFHAIMESDIPPVDPDEIKDWSNSNGFYDYEDISINPLGGPITDLQKRLKAHVDAVTDTAIKAIKELAESKAVVDSVHDALKIIRDYWGGPDGEPHLFLVPNENTPKPEVVKDGRWMRWDKPVPQEDITAVGDTIAELFKAITDEEGKGDIEEEYILNPKLRYNVVNFTDSQIYGGFSTEEEAKFYASNTIQRTGKDIRVVDAMSDEGKKFWDPDGIKYRNGDPMTFSGDYFTLEYNLSEEQKNIIQSIFGDDMAENQAFLKTLKTNIQDMYFGVSQMETWKEHTGNYLTGQDVYEEFLLQHLGNDKKTNKKAASLILKAAGFDGITYPVAFLSGGSGDDGMNYVVFDDKAVKIQHRQLFQGEGENAEADAAKAHQFSGLDDPSLAAIKDEARNMDTWEEFATYMDHFWDDEMKRLIGADKIDDEKRMQLYKELWETANQSANYGSDMGTWAKSIEANDYQGLKEFLAVIWDEIISGETYNFQPADIEEADKLNAAKERSTRIGAEIAEVVKAGAIRVGSKGKDLSPKFLASIMGVIKKNPEAYARIYAEIYDIPELLEASKTAEVEKFADIEDPKFKDRRMTISQKAAIADVLRNEEIGKKILSGDIVVGEEVKKYIDSIRTETKEQKKTLDTLKSEITEDNKMLKAWEKRWVEASSRVNQADQELKKINARIDKLGTENKRIPKALLDEQVSLKRIRETMEAQRERARRKVGNPARLQTALAKVEEATRMKIAAKDREVRRRAAQKLKTYHTQLEKQIKTKPSEKINAEQAIAILDIQKMVDPHWRSDKTRERIEELRAELEKNPALSREVGKEWLKRATRKSLDEFTLTELEEMATKIKALRTEGRAIWKTKEEARQQYATSAQERIADLLLHLPGAATPGDKPDSDSLLGKLAGKVRDFDYAFTKAQQFARLMDGAEDGPNYELLIMERDRAYRVEMQEVERRVARIKEAFDREELNPEEWYKQEVTLKGAGPGRTDRVIRKSDVLALELAFRNEDSRQAALFGNFFSHYEKRNMTEEELYFEAAERFSVVRAAMDSVITEKDLRILETFAADGDETGRRLFETVADVENRVMEMVDNYFPINREGVTGDPIDVQIAGDVLNRTPGTKRPPKNGFTKSRINISPKHQTPIKLDLLTTWMKGIQAHEHYIANAAYARRLNDVYLNNFMQEQIRAGLGDQGVAYLKDYIAEVKNPGSLRNMARWENSIKWLRGSVGAAYLGFRLSSTFKQYVTSPWPAMAYAGPKRFLAETFKQLANPIKYVMDAEKLSTVLRNRTADLVLEAVKTATAKTATGRKVKKFNEIAMKGLEIADRHTVAIGWRAMFEKEMADHGDMQIAIEKADDMVLKTQPSARGVDLAPIYRTGGEATKMLLQFTTPMNVIWNNLRHDLPAAIKDKHYARAVGIITGYVISGVLLSLATEGGDDDEDENRGALLAFYAFTQGTESIPLIGQDITRVVRTALTGAPGYDFPDTMLPGASQVFDGLTTMVKDADNWERGLEQFASGVGITVGLPVSGAKEIKRVIEGDYGALMGKPRRRD